MALLIRGETPLTVYKDNIDLSLQALIVDDDVDVLTGVLLWPPMMSLNNIVALATNDVAQQHCGQPTP